MSKRFEESPNVYQVRHIKGERYVRAFLSIEEVDEFGNPIRNQVAVGVTLKADIRTLLQYPGLEGEVLGDLAARAMHQLIRDTPQAALVFEFKDKVTK